MTSARRQVRYRRRGLSTLEMVLATPILLFIMALMVNYGTIATWKVRGLSMAREAVWGTRWQRTGYSNPTPDYWWPDGATSHYGKAGNVEALADDRVDQPVARGPMLLDTPVNRDLLDPTRGLREGSAELSRTFPMLGKMGKYHFEAENFILDDHWQYQRTGLYSNRQRRIPVIYYLQKAPASVVEAYVNVVKAIMNAPFQKDLAPLDRDEEFIEWGRSPPDFHPRLQMFCTLDLQVSDERVEDLIERIDEVPERMAKTFISFYKWVIHQLEDQLNSIPPPSPSEQANIQARIKQYEDKIKQLEQFLQTLSQNDS